MHTSKDTASLVIESAITSFRANKGWSDKAVAQLPDARLHVALDPNTNSVAVWETITIPHGESANYNTQVWGQGNYRTS